MNLLTQRLNIDLILLMIVTILPLMTTNAVVNPLAIAARKRLMLAGSK